MSSPQVSGRAFLGLIRHVRERHGADALGTAVKSMRPSTREALSKRVLHAHWYAYDAYAGFLVGLESSFGHGAKDFARTLGLVTGQFDLNTVFRVYVALASTERLIRGCTKVWASYYQHAGEMTAISSAPEDTCLRITGFPEMLPQHCRLMEGWMIAAMSSIGVEVSADARETKCASRGDPFHEFRCTWRKK